VEHLVLSSSVITVPACTAVRREALEARGLRFDAALRYAVDWDLWVRLALTAKFGYLNRLTCQYRVHQNNMTSAGSLPQRKQDLLPSRLKVLEAPWFGQFALATRTAFLYDLLIYLLGDLPEQQSTIMDGVPFSALPVGPQADLLRLVASNHLIKRQNVAFALGCLRQSVKLQPRSIKSRALLLSGSRSASFAATILSSWQIGHRAAVDIRHFGRRRPRPVPTALMPTSE